MKEIGILFTSDMVRALLAKRKTQTRRLVKHRTDKRGHSYVPACCYGVPGDRLWVRENFAANIPGCEIQNGITYQADHIDPRGDGPANPIKWTPSIHMPRKVSRILLEVTHVRAERVKDISEADALAEGICRISTNVGGRYGLPSWRKRDWRESAREAYLHLFYGINKRMPVTENPWVWVISFKEVTA